MIDDPWDGDRLDRKATGIHLIQLLKNRFERRRETSEVASYTLNLDASWGQGKSFFLERLTNALRKESHIVATVNAWQDDHGDDPLVTVMTAIEEALTPFLKGEGTPVSDNLKKAKQALSTVAAEAGKQASLHFVKMLTGISVGAIVDELKQNDVLEANTELDVEKLDSATEEVWKKLSEGLVPQRVTDHKLAKRKAGEFRQYAAKAIAHAVDNGMRSPMFIIIDELDRCRPLYAIKLLEEVKHLFSIDGVVFIIATDTAQLAHSVKAIYGHDFEARRYLRRFFDQTFVFPEANRAAFINSLLERHGIDIVRTFYPTGEINPISHFVSWANAFKLSNRDIEQCMEMVSIFVASWEHDGVKIDPVYMLLLIWLFYAHNTVNDAPSAGNTNTVLSSWVQTYQYKARGQLKQPVLNGDRILGELGSVSTTPLTLLDNFQTNLYYEQLKEERFTRLGYNWMQNATDDRLPTLSEYMSRVHNAGRTLDKNQI